jgi:enoyl-CoA hydratase
VIEEIVATRRGRVGQIVIDRPRALNALDGRMFAELGRVLEAWKSDDAVEAVVVRGTGTSFSAGGDIRTVREAALAGDQATLDRMYFDEYRLNALIDGYPKPFVAAVDGYCMGGGLGVAMYGDVVAVTERAQLAMPEVGIGFFPDVGASYVLPRLPDRVGWYMGLTGTRIGPADALALGLATHQLDDDAFARVEEIVDDVPAPPSAAPGGLVGAIATRFQALAVRPGVPALEPHRAAIARCFAEPALLGVIAALEREATPWAAETLTTMRRASPTSLALTFELFRRGSALTLAQSLEMEYQLAVRTCRSAEFLEGVRAMVIDKDRTPHWQPARIEDISQAALDVIWSEIDITRNELHLT